jgi:hypothetical protein
MALRQRALIAGVLVLVLGCGAIAPSPGDAALDANPDMGARPSPTTAPDGAVPGMPRGGAGVTVTVVDHHGVPKKDARVLFHDSTGAVTGEAYTDVSGKVATASAPSMVTVLTIDYGPRPALVTYLDVKDGDELSVGYRPPPAVPAGSFDVKLMGAEASATTISILAAGNCGSPNAPSAGDVVFIAPTCGGGATNAVLVTASSASGVLGFASAKDVPAPATTGAVVPVGPLAFTMPGAIKVTASNLPSSPPVATSASMFAIADDRSFLLPAGAGVLDAGGLDFATPTGFADAYQTALSATRDNSTSTLARREAASAAASGTLATFDFTTALPFIDGVVITSTEPMRPDVEIKALNGSLATADAGFVAINFMAAGSSDFHTWTFVVPPATTAFKMPALPANATDYLPTGTATPSIVQFLDLSQLAGYQAAKAVLVVPSLGFEFLNAARLDLALPVGGSLRVSYWP